MINRKLRKHLFGKIKVTPQALNQRAQRLKDKYGPMTTDEAVYIIAHLEGIDLSRYLPLDKLDRIRSLVPREINTKVDKLMIKRKPRQRKLSTISYPLIINSEIQVAITAGEEAYPNVFVVENSIRKFIDLKLSKISTDWWNKYVSKTIQDKVQRRIDIEKRYTHREQRGNKPILYCDFIELRNIIEQNYRYFSDVIINLDWFKTMMDEVYMARNNLAHSIPLSKDDISQIAIFFREWARVLESAKIK